MAVTFDVDGCTSVLVVEASGVPVNELAWPVSSVEACRSVPAFVKFEGAALIIRVVVGVAGASAVTAIGSCTCRGACTDGCTLMLPVDLIKLGVLNEAGSIAIGDV